jgi:type III secretion protein T
MDGLLRLDELGAGALALMAAASRVGAAFFMFPAFAPDTVPPLVRNSVFVALGLVALVLQPGLEASDIGAFRWLAIFVTEAAVGVVLGFLFAAVVWAFEIAGGIIDAQIGMTMAMIVDPLSGHETSLTGAFLARLAVFVFMAVGGMSLFVGALLASYALWPVGAAAAVLDPAGAAFFADEWQDIMGGALALASPAIVVLALVDLTLGLINRYAQQLNVFSMSMAIKSWIAVGVLLMLLAALVDQLAGLVISRPDAVSDALRALFPPR